MKKIAILLAACLLLTGCTSSKREQVQAYYSTIETAQMQAQIIVHLGGDDRTFGVACTYDRAGGTTTTITEPEELRGLSATFSGEDMTLSYDGSVWPAGDGGMLSAANCLPLVLQAAGMGYVTEEGRDRLGDTEYLRLSAELTVSAQTYAATLWVEPDGFAPYAAELSKDGAVLLTIHFTQFLCETAQS